MVKSFSFSPPGGDEPPSPEEARGQLGRRLHGHRPGLPGESLNYYWSLILSGTLSWVKEIPFLRDNARCQNLETQKKQ